jgi:hypothetical protein
MSSKPKIIYILGCSPIFFVLAIVFALLTLSASIPGLNRTIARYALCPTASSAYYEESSGGTVDKPGVQSDVSTRIYTLHCEYAGAPARQIDNDVIFLTGIAAAAGVGLVLGLLVYFVAAMRSRIAAPAE